MKRNILSTLLVFGIYTSVFLLTYINGFISDKGAYSFDFKYTYYTVTLIFVYCVFIGIMVSLFTYRLDTTSSTFKLFQLILILYMLSAKVCSFLLDRSLYNVIYPNWIYINANILFIVSSTLLGILANNFCKQMFIKHRTNK